MVFLSPNHNNTHIDRHHNPNLFIFLVTVKQNPKRNQQTTQINIKKKKRKSETNEKLYRKFTCGLWTL